MQHMHASSKLVHGERRIDLVTPSTYSTHDILHPTPLALLPCLTLALAQGRSERLG